MRPFLSSLDKLKALENSDNFARLEDREITHLRDADRMGSYELGFELRFTVFKKQLKHFF